jgi:energy-coupling factor transporter ATP-binding protein EcfA2
MLLCLTPTFHQAQQKKLISMLGNRPTGIASYPYVSRHPQRNALLKRLRLINFRSFRDFSISFGEGTYLVGPNNAGKSTILTALRTADVLIRYAHRRKPSLRCFHNDRSITAYPLVLADFPALEESVRHEFHEDKEARFELTLQSGARLVAVWPKVDDDDDDPQQNYFYLESQPGILVRDPVSAKATFPLLGVVPILSPVEHAEGLRDDSYVRTSVSTRLSSRHFRNQLRLMLEDGSFAPFSTYIEPWLDDFGIDSIGHHFDNNNGMLLDVYYKEHGSNVPKELVWAGDGIQVWLQILYHVYRTRDRDTVILDEPDIYLHPDLQRKLVQLLEETGRQIVVATHSSEIITEADPKHVTIVDKKQKRSRRADENADLELLSKALGTAFNLRLARALRSKTAVFVEGKDMAVLRELAKTLGMTALASERGITVIPLEGYTRSIHVSPFAWLCRSLLPEAIKIFIVLDHDYRPQSLSQKLETDFAAEGITAHVWRRKELESYLITPSVIARISKLGIDEVKQTLDQIALGMENFVFARMLSEQTQLEKPTGKNETTITEHFMKEFSTFWQDPDRRLYSCPAKDVLAELNKLLQGTGKKAVSTRALAKSHAPYEIPQEMSAFLRQVEESSFD